MAIVSNVAVKLVIFTIFCLCRIAHCQSYRRYGVRPYELSAESVFEILSHSISKLTDRMELIETDIVAVKERLENIETLVKNPNELDKTHEEYRRRLKQDLSEQRSALFRMMSVEKNIVRDEVDKLNGKFIELANSLRSESSEFRKNLREELSSTKESLDARADELKLIANQLSSKTSDLSSRTSSEPVSSMSSWYHKLLSELSEDYFSVNSALRSKLSSIASDISSLSSRISEEEETKVGFTARLMNADSYYASKERIKFDGIIYNHGSGYNSSTGIFTAPKSGTYLFSFNVEATSQGKIHAALFEDGYLRASALVHKGPSMTGSNTAVFYVSKGEKVWVQTAGLEPKYYLAPYRTQFVGVLID